MNFKHYNKILNIVGWDKVFSVLVIAFIVGVLTILHVLIGFAKTQSGAVYLWTGHYYLDYFYYLQFIAQGLRGYWLPRQYSATDDPSIYFHLQPYVLIGQIGRIFHLNPIALYWLSVSILAMILALCIFLVIREILKDSPFYLKFGAYLLTLSAGPFYRVISDSLGIRISTFDYWASYGTFFKRFEPVPHHLLANILTLVTLLICVRYLKVYQKSYWKTLKYALIISVLLILELSFFPFLVLFTFSAIALTIVFFFFSRLILHHKQRALFLITFVGIVGSLTFLAGILIKKIYEAAELFSKIKAMEVIWSNKIPLETTILNLGPVFIFSLFGLREYMKKLNTMRVLLLTFVLTSYILFYSPLDRVLQTHNGRFLSPLNYILFGSLASLGMLSMTSFVYRIKKFLFFFLIFLFILFSLPPNLQAFTSIVNDKNINSPITYIPKGIIAGFEFLGKQKRKGNTLITPSQFLGSILPIYADTRTYVVRHPETPNYIQKNIQTSNFYLGAMLEKDAYEFLEKNNLTFVVLTSIEGYDVAPLYRYPFLEEVYKNKDIVIFEVNPDKNRG